VAPVRTVRDPWAILVVAVAVGLWAPLARLEWFNGHERFSYVLRTVEWASELRLGVIYPRWCPDFYGGYGSPLFFFYGPTLYAIAGLLTALGLDVLWALKVVVLLGSILSGVGTYALVRAETGRRDAALLAAVAYLAAPYRIGNLFDRGDIGEFSCIALLPVVLALYRAAAREALPQRAYGLAVVASVVHGVMILTHPVLGLWGSVVTGLVVLASLIRPLLMGAWRRAGALVLAVACAPALVGFYVVPAMLYKTQTQTARMVVGFYDPRHHWVTVQQLFEKSIPLFLRNFLQIGPLVAVAGVLLVAALAWRPRRALGALGWFALSLLLIASMLPIAGGFWAKDRIPLVEFIQFPWRLLGPAALASSVVVGLAVAILTERFDEETRSSIAIVGSAAFLLVIAWPFVSTGEMLAASVPRDPETIRRGMYSATDADEYLPKGVPSPPRSPRRGLVAKPSGVKVDFADSQGSYHALVLRAEKAGATADLALHSFPGWKIETKSGPAKAKLGVNSQGLVRVVLPEPGKYRLAVWFGVAPAEWLGLFVTFGGCLALLPLALYGSRFWPPDLRALRMALSARGARA
jgi:hypothetical protein